MNEPGKVTRSIRLDQRVYDNAAEIATAEGRSFNNWVTRVIEYAVARAKIDSGPSVTIVPAVDLPEPSPLMDIVNDAIQQEQKARLVSRPTGVRWDPEAMPPDMPDPVHRTRHQPPDYDKTFGAKAKVQPAVFAHEMSDRPRVRPAKTEANPIPKKGGKK